MQKLLSILLTAALLLCGCASPAPQPAESSSAPDAPPEFSEITNEEVGDLFVKAMREIIELATEDPVMTLKISVFPEEDIEIYYDNCITINEQPYAKTSKLFSELVEYYENIFTGEALEWISTTKFADIDGALYCCLTGGASGYDIQLISVENTLDNTYRATYTFSYNDLSEKNTLFEVQQTDAGYRISSIDYCPGFFATFPNLGKDNKYSP